jgi:hypothetical protein
VDEVEEGSESFEFLIITCDKIMALIIFHYLYPIINRAPFNKGKSSTMVRKRVRDPEVLPEAPQMQIEDDGSGSDTVSSTNCF